MVTGSEKVLLGEISQIGIVVTNLRNSMERYWRIFGLGPWRIYTYEPPRLIETMVRGKPEPYSMKLAFATAGPMIELIEPLDGNSIYKEFLAERGEGLHHIASFAVDDVDKAIAQLEKQGIGVLQSGKYCDGDFNVFFAYMDTEKELDVIVELVRLHGRRPSPEATYP